VKLQELDIQLKLIYISFSSLSFAQKNAVAAQLGYVLQYSSSAGEWVGKYKDTSLVNYTQSKSYFTSSDALPSSENNGYATYNSNGTFKSYVSKDVNSSVNDGYNSPNSVNDDGSAVWDVSYNVSSKQSNTDTLSGLLGFTDGTGYRTLYINNALSTVGQTGVVTLN
jgi:type II secretory pathway pseudopilin PulG